MSRLNDNERQTLIQISQCRNPEETNSPRKRFVWNTSFRTYYMTRWWVLNLFDFPFVCQSPHGGIICFHLVSFRHQLWQHRGWLGKRFSHAPAHQKLSPDKWMKASLVHIVILVHTHSWQGCLYSYSSVSLYHSLGCPLSWKWSENIQEGKWPAVGVSDQKNAVNVGINIHSNFHKKYTGVYVHQTSNALIVMPLLIYGCCVLPFANGILSLSRSILFYLSAWMR